MATCHIFTLTTMMLLLWQPCECDPFSIQLFINVRSGHLSQPKVAEATPTEDLTCWTCYNMTDNEACNNWAPDILCPLDHTVCKTVHRFNPVTMETDIVTKTCAKPSECSYLHVGCQDDREHSNLKECTSCCTDSYCNEDAPVDGWSAVLVSGAKSGHQTSNTIITSLIITSLIITNTRQLL